MDINQVSYNLVLKKKQVRPNDINLNDIKLILIQKLEFDQPILNQFPDFAVIFFPSKQVSLVLQQDTVIINDNSGSVDGYEQLSNIACQINEHLSENNLFAYGYNFSFECIFQNNDTALFQSFLDNKILNKYNLADNLSPGPIKIINNYSDYSYTVSIIPRSDNNKNISKYFHVDFNVHFSKKVLPSLQILVKDIIEKKEYIKNLILKFDENQKPTKKKIAKKK